MPRELRRRSAVASDISSDIKALQKTRLSWRGGACIFAGTLLVAWMLGLAGRFELVRPIIFTSVVVGFVIASKREQARRPWFWITMAVIAGIHVPLILSIPWTTKWVPAAAIVPLAVADLYAILATLSVVGRFVEKR